MLGGEAYNSEKGAEVCQKVEICREHLMRKRNGGESLTGGSGAQQLKSLSREGF